jgi:hypothetical protein
MTAGSAAKLLAPIVTLLAASVLASCGGGGDDGTTSSAAGSPAADAQVAQTIRTSIMSSDPADCLKLETLRFLQQIHFTSGEAAVKACQADAPDTSDDPDSIDVKNVAVQGDKATADATFTGGGFDGSTLALSLVKQDDQWKLDEITAIPAFDLQAFEKAFTQRLVTNEGVQPQAVGCVANALNQAGAAVVKAALISGSSSHLLNLIGPCLSGSSAG